MTGAYDNSTRWDFGDPEVAELMKAFHERQRTTIDLRPFSNYVLDGEWGTAASRQELPSEPTESIAESHWLQKETEIVAAISGVLGAEFCDVSAEHRLDAYMGICESLLQSDWNTPIVYLTYADIGSLDESSQVYSYLRRIYNKLAVVQTSDFAFSELVQQEMALINPELVIVDLSRYPLTPDLTWLRDISDSLDAKLLVDISYFLGLAVGGLYQTFTNIADLVVGDTYGTLGGPVGSVIMGLKKYERSVRFAMTSRHGSDVDYESMVAKNTAIRWASTLSNRRHLQRMIDNARELATRLKESGATLAFESTDSHIVVIEAPKDIGFSDSLDRLKRVGIIAEGGKYMRKTKGMPRESVDGLFLGTTVVSARGMRPPDMKGLADAIVGCLGQISGDELDRCGNIVRNLCATYPS